MSVEYKNIEAEGLGNQFQKSGILCSETVENLTANVMKKFLRAPG